MESTHSSKDSFKSANSGDKTPASVDVLVFDDEEYRRKTRTRLVVIAASIVVLLLATAGLIVGILVPKNSVRKPSLSMAELEAIKAVCDATQYPDSCYSTILSQKMSTTQDSSSHSPDSPTQIFVLSLQATMNELVTLQAFISQRLEFPRENEHKTTTHNALCACARLINDAINHVNMSISSSTTRVDDTRTWLSTAITDQETCLNALTEFQNIPPSTHKEIKTAMQNATIFTSNSLAIITKISTDIPRETPRESDARWMHRKLLEAEDGKLKPNITVAKDGSGDYGNITEAVRFVPKRSNKRFFIYVKQGEYQENVVVDSDSWNLMIYGDGMSKTLVSASLNYADGVATFDSGTLIVEGRGFIAKDIGFRNRAGPRKLQAVAARCSSDESIFHRCSFDGYQDTLYTHTNRQYYHECVVTGTIDFIFGNAAAVFHKCSIRPRQPEPGQYNTVTAQSKSDPNQNTGISIQQCRISPLDNLTARTYIGRPWNNYSTAVIMETEMEAIIDPAGWAPWEPDMKPPDTIFYAEYNNSGPGSVLGGRVNWPGYKPNITEKEAQKFSVDNFIQGAKWLADWIF